jgi:hypothetical protein
MEAMGCRSVRGFAKRTVQDHSVVARHLRLLRLPDEIIGSLEENQTPEILRQFTVKRLDELTRMPEDEATASFTRQIQAVRRASSALADMP